MNVGKGAENAAIASWAARFAVLATASDHLHAHKTTALHSLARRLR